MILTPKKITDLILYLAIIIFLFGSGYKIAEWRLIHGSRDQITYTVFNANNNLPKDTKHSNIDFSLFWDAWNKLEQKYIDKKKLNPQKMFYGALKGMVASVEDPYTFFLTPDENKQSKDDLMGKFEGIGAQLGIKENKIVIVSPLKESPAEKAGLLPGDFIIKVDGVSTEKWTLVQAVSKIRGPENSKVTLTINRQNTINDFKITRKAIKIPTVEVSLEKTKGMAVSVIKLNQFGTNTNEEWDKVIPDISKKWKAKLIKGLVLDLRGNPGGYLESSVYIGSEFLPKNKIIVRQESTGAANKDYRVERDGALLDIPLIVLINEGSASASEILSGALRDYKRAKLVGQKSFGKGSVQQALDLQQGAGIHVTISKWLLPKGEWINGKGIVPDIIIDNSVDQDKEAIKDNDKQLKKAIELLIQ